MKKIFYAVIPLLAAIVVITPYMSYAVSAHEWFLFGAYSNTSASGQKNAKMSVTIATPQSFSNTNEDHNWHVQMQDSNGYKHNVGYFVRQDASSTPKFFDEELQGSTLKHSFEGISSVGNNGDVKDFAMAWGGGAWNYYLGTTSQDQGIVGPGSTFDALTMYAVTEKICPTSPYCTKDQGGALPSVQTTNAMSYSSSLTFPPSSWTGVANARAYYQYIDNGGLGGGTGSAAQSEMCQPMSMKGHAQDSTLSNNQLVTGNNVVTTCTAADANVWP